MDQSETSPAGQPAGVGAPPAQPVNSQFAFHNGFLAGDGRLQAGWRLLIFLGIVFVLFGVLRAVAKVANHGHAGNVFSAGTLAISEIVSFGVILFASWIMTKIEGRKMADYGLPARGAFRRSFWTGALVGFLSITALLVALHIAGVFGFGGLAVHGGRLFGYAALWGVAFIFVGLFEEFSFRGYVQFTLTSALGFWPSALLLSFFFGYIHYGNSGETKIGAFSAGLVGLFFCLLLRRTGDLWLPIGFHAAWDWGETYFYGVPDSGQVGPGHLLSAHFGSGHIWLTGGTVGPEGSWFCLALTGILWLIFALWLRRAKYPKPDAFPAPEHAPYRA